MVNNESSNPYVEIKSRGKRYKTQVIKETVEPVFQERISGTRLLMHVRTRVRTLGGSDV